MPNILLVDDRPDIRTSLSRHIEANLPKSWSITDVHPFVDIEDYITYITENNVVVVLLDERLNESINESSDRINYKGSDLVDRLRSSFATLPIFVITSYAEDADLQNRFKDVEDIIERRDFSPKIDNYVERILRSAQQYLQTYERELSDLSEYSSKIARGIATDADIAKARAICEIIGRPFLSETFLEGQKRLNLFEKEIDELSNMIDEIKGHIDE